MIKVKGSIYISEDELEITAVCSQGKGGQNVNKVATAIHLRFNIVGSSIPEHIKSRLISTSDKRITREGILIIKAQRFRTQEKNRQDAIRRLEKFFEDALFDDIPRIPTKTPKKAEEKRLKLKNRKADIKKMRKPPSMGD
ncbi:MAG: aminoacyl-tRNA hydrolase [Deltaproteobacteria bacterium]|nr:aminoacyl-tRNA hydrolase [Deltaproteobacteria bacterium]